MIRPRCRCAAGSTPSRPAGTRAPASTSLYSAAPRSRIARDDGRRGRSRCRGDSSPQHNEAVARKILFHRVGVAVVVHVVPAEQHLPRRPAMHEHDARFRRARRRARTGARGRHEQLPVYRRPVGCLERDMLRRHELFGGEVLRRLIGRERARRRARRAFAADRIEQTDVRQRGFCVFGDVVFVGDLLAAPIPDDVLVYDHAVLPVAAYIR